MLGIGPDASLRSVGRWIALVLAAHKHILAYAMCWDIRWRVYEVPLYAMLATVAVPTLLVWRFRLKCRR